MTKRDKDKRLSASNQLINRLAISFYSLYLAQQPAPNAPKGIKSDIFKGIGEKFFGVKEGADPTGPGSADTIAELISFVVQILLVVAGSIAVIFLIVGAYRYITAHGNEEQMEAAKKTMTSAIVGLVIIVVAFAIISIIINILLQGPTGTGLGVGGTGGGGGGGGGGGTCVDVDSNGIINEQDCGAPENANCNQC